MHIKVVYHSMTGNSKKLALAIAEELKVKAQNAKEADATSLNDVDLLFIGDGIYAGKAGKAMLEFIDKLNAKEIKNAAVFATYGGQDKIGADLIALLKNKGINVIGDAYTCKGKAWFIANRSHPTEDELNGVKEFAKRILEQINVTK